VWTRGNWSPCTSSTRLEAHRLFRKLASFEEAKRIIEQNFSPKPVGVERVSISEAYGRVLAEDIVATMDVPPFNRSTVDGYAVKASDTFGAEEDQPITLRLCGQVAVGEYPGVIVEGGTAAEIVTGAPLPKGADAVVMMEHTNRRNDTIFVHRPVSRGENVMKAGSDIPKGQAVLQAGQRLASKRIGVLAALGLAKVKVYSQPRVAVISTGEEIVEPGKTLPPGKIYDINAPTLSAAVLECGGKPINLGIVPDEKDQLKSALERALNMADVVITSGGVSVGPRDLLPLVLDELGEPGVLFSGVATKPGKPLTFALVNGKPVFSLPGHPTSSLLTFHLFVRPILCSMAGKREHTTPTLRAVTTSKIFPARGRRTFVMVSLTRDESGRMLASPVPLGLSGAITTLVKAEGFIQIPENQQFIDEGSEVTVHLFEKKFDSVLDRSQ